MAKAYWISCYRAIHKPEALAAYAATDAGTKGPEVMVKGQPNVKAEDF